MKRVLKLLIIILIIAATWLGASQYYSAKEVGNTEVEAKNDTSLVALVNLDEGVDDQDGTKINYGNFYIAKFDGDIEVVSNSSAEAGMDSGKYGAIITVPSDFSKGIVSFNDVTSVKAIVEYEINDNLSVNNYTKTNNIIKDFSDMITYDTSYLYVKAMIEEVNAAQLATGTIIKNDKNIIEDLKNADIIVDKEELPQNNSELILSDEPEIEEFDGEVEKIDDVDLTETNETNNEKYLNLMTQYKEAEKIFAEQTIAFGVNKVSLREQNNNYNSLYPAYSEAFELYSKSLEQNSSKKQIEENEAICYESQKDFVISLPPISPTPLLTYAQVKDKLYAQMYKNGQEGGEIGDCHDFYLDNSNPEVDEDLIPLVKLGKIVTTDPIVFDQELPVIDENIDLDLMTYTDKFNEWKTQHLNANETYIEAFTTKVNDDKKVINEYLTTDKTIVKDYVKGQNEFTTDFAKITSENYTKSLEAFNKDKDADVDNVSKYVFENVNSVANFNSILPNSKVNGGVNASYIDFSIAPFMLKDNTILEEEVVEEVVETKQTSYIIPIVVILVIAMVLGTVLLVLKKKKTDE